MDRRSFLKRLSTLAVGAGLVAVAPPAVEAAAQPSAPSADELVRAAVAVEPVAVPEGCIVFDEATGGYIQKTADGWRPFTFQQQQRRPDGRRLLSSLSDREIDEVVRNSLVRMGRMGDDAFLPGDEEVIWRWEQVRQTVLVAYGGHRREDMQRKIIALPAVADALFTKGEPGHREWQEIRTVMFQFAERALRV